MWEITSTYHVIETLQWRSPAHNRNANCQLKTRYLEGREVRPSGIGPTENLTGPYCDLRLIGLPIATRKIAALPVACGEKKLITSSSKKVSPVAPKP